MEFKRGRGSICLFTMSYKRGDILIVNFPYTDLTNTKKRPAVVVKDLEGQNIILCQMSTKKHTLSKYEVLVRRSDCIGNIRFDSFVFTDIIATLHKGVIFEKIGSINDMSVKKELDEK